MAGLVPAIHVFNVGRPKTRMPGTGLHSGRPTGRTRVAGHDGERAMKKSFVRGERAEKRAYSPVVITEGSAKTLWLAGHTGAVDDAGKSLAGDFDAQCRQTFRNIEKTLAQAGAKLADLVTMTVFLIDARYTTRMTELRVEIFGKDFPASAAITVAGFAQPEMMIEIQCVAVIAA
jgi:enamine deaminase RidA (YjgF/YER057c/UK114 family)